jgi:hypothetical protein
MKATRYLIWLMKGTACVALAIGGSGYFLPAHADDADDHAAEEFKARRGLEIAPVPLNLRHRNRELVGLGSYLVNAVGDCNGCHSAGPDTEYAPGGNPYFKGNPPAVVNQATYLGGGRDFGPLVPGLTPNIVSRNLTPDRTGRPVGGRSFAQFRQVMRTGEDLDHLHPNCSDSKTTNCFPAMLPFNGELLQIMPWPQYQHMSELELLAIYEYLAAIPCVAGPKTGALHNDCN